MGFEPTISWWRDDSRVVSRVWVVVRRLAIGPRGRLELTSRQISTYIYQQLYRFPIFGMHCYKSSYSGRTQAQSSKSLLGMTSYWTCDSLECKLRWRTVFHKIQMIKFSQLVSGYPSPSIIVLCLVQTLLPRWNLTLWFPILWYRIQSATKNDPSFRYFLFCYTAWKQEHCMHPDA